MPPGRSVSPPSPNNATTLSHTRSTRYRSCEITTSVPGHESSRSSSCCSVSMSRSFVGSSSSSTFGSAISSRHSCSRRRSPPDRSETGVHCFCDENPNRSPSCDADISYLPSTTRRATSSIASSTRIDPLQVEQLLREVRDLHRLALDPLAGLGFALPGQQPQQRRLAGPVDADQTDPLAGADAPRQVLHQHPVRNGQCRVLELDHRAAQALLGEREQLDGVARRRHVRDQRLGGLDPVARLRRAGGRAAAQPGELLARQVLPLLLGRVGEPGPLGAREDPVRVAALVLLDLALHHFPRAVADGVEEPPVVGHDDERGPAGEQVLREPAHALDVEVVRRLVEHEQVEVLDQRGRQRDPAALATGHRGDHGVQAQRRDPESVQNGPNAGVGRPLVLGVVPERVDHRVAHGRAVGQLGPLRHDGHPQTPRARHPAVVRGLLPGEHLEQRRLAAAVQADDADPVALVDAERHAVEQRPDAERLRDGLQVDQVGHRYLTTRRNCRLEGYLPAKTACASPQLVHSAEQRRSGGSNYACTSGGVGFLGSSVVITRAPGTGPCATRTVRHTPAPASLGGHPHGRVVVLAQERRASARNRTRSRPAHRRRPRPAACAAGSAAARRRRPGGRCPAAGRAAGGHRRTDPPAPPRPARREAGRPRRAGGPARRTRPAWTVRAGRTPAPSGTGGAPSTGTIRSPRPVPSAVPP